MNKTRKNVFKSAKMFMSKHSPEILIGLGITGMITTTVLAVRATPRALALIEQKKQEEHKDKLTPAETIKTAWKCYIPAGVTCATSVACLIGANSAHMKRNAALATAYKISETAFTEYREKMIETIGEKKEQTVREKIDHDRVEKQPVSKNEVVVTKRGNTLCFDPLSGRYFESDIDQIKKAENNVNKQMLHDTFGYATVNEFYDELGLDRTDVGDIIGWNVHKLIDIHISSKVADDGRPCIVVGHNNRPVYDYDRF